ncbi:hypothetical protein HF521_015423 [Silurus meridionalis]|uniref:SEA domain-containing protein n=1 Tax=Silurus meridionalis TaxID=175797 RepID=A0A8T0A783_SILME|nr:hypothetical protein HF521_015423 [Silurus meridionalis]
MANSTNIRNQVNPFFRRNFTNFIDMQILKFSNGSTITTSNLYMNSNGPNATASQVKTVFLSGLNTFTFRVDPNSVNVTQTLANSMAPVIASSLSIICISLLSLLLSMASHH